MPPNALITSNTSNTNTSNMPLATTNGNTDCARRRHNHSNDMKIKIENRYGALPLTQQPTGSTTGTTTGSSSPSRIGFASRRRRIKSHTSMRFRTRCIFAIDFIVLGYVFRSIFIYMWLPTTKRIEQQDLMISTVDLSSGLVPLSFEKSLFNEESDLPTCNVLDPDEVNFTLALHLSDNRLWMMQHHCELWGTSAPISIAIWTSIGPDEIMAKLKLMGCDTDYIHLQTLSSKGHEYLYPINQLRNMALKGASTSHVLLLDVDFWESEDLFDSLNSPSVRNALSKDPKLAMVIPAFETQDLKCGTSMKCKARTLYWIPKDFEDLVLSLGSNKALPYDPTNFSRQGSTDYRRWMKQSSGEIVEIPCVSSDQYQPYLVVRLCNDLPPFQERFVGHGRNKMAWMLHLLRLGYRLQQVGRIFVTHFPHENYQSRSSEWEKESDGMQSTGLRVPTDQTYWEFKKWLESNVEDAAEVAKCEDFTDDENSLST